MAHRLAAISTLAALAVGGLWLAAGGAAWAQSSQARLVEEGGQRCLISNGTPNHAMGRFPNSGNPHRFRQQQLRYCFAAKPVKGPRATYGAQVVGVALNGVPMRPGVADFYDPRSPRGFSRDRSSGWRLEGMGSAAQLGIDASNAHVDARGLYHYHGKPTGFLRTLPKGRTLVGYAADGFEIHYVGAKVRPSWRLKQGSRPTEPFGRYDGRFLQDWEYVSGSGTLDECNGGDLGGRFVYFVTEAFPFFPRCHWGAVGPDFQRQGRGRRGGGRGPGGPGGGGRGGPLAAAAQELGVSVRALREAIGPPPPDIRRGARILGVSEERLRDVLRRNRPRRP